MQRGQCGKHGIGVLALFLDSRLLHIITPNFQPLKPRLHANDSSKLGRSLPAYPVQQGTVVEASCKQQVSHPLIQPSHVIASLRTSVLISACAQTAYIASAMQQEKGTDVRNVLGFLV